MDASQPGLAAGYKMTIDMAESMYKLIFIRIYFTFARNWSRCRMYSVLCVVNGRKFESHIGCRHKCQSIL